MYWQIAPWPLAVSWFHWEQWHSWIIWQDDDNTGRDRLRNNSHRMNSYPFILLSVWHLWHQMFKCLPLINHLQNNIYKPQKLIIMSCWLFWAGPLSQRIWNVVKSCWRTIDMRRQFFVLFLFLFLFFVFCYFVLFVSFFVYWHVLGFYRCFFN